MPQNFIRHPGISALANSLVHNPELRILNLNDNTFTWRGSEAVASALPNWQQLEVINFGDCLIRTKGAEFLAKALAAGFNNLRVLPYYFTSHYMHINHEMLGSVHGPW